MPVWVKTWVRQKRIFRKTCKPNRNAPKSIDSGAFLARHEGFEPPAFWSVASLQASKFAFSALSAPFVPQLRRHSGAVSHPLLSAHFLSWVKMWVRPRQPQKLSQLFSQQILPRLNQRKESNGRESVDKGKSRSSINGLTCQFKHIILRQKQPGRVSSDNDILIMTVHGNIAPHGVVQKNIRVVDDP